MIILQICKKKIPPLNPFKFVMKHKSQQLIDDLVAAKFLSPKLCDLPKLRSIINNILAGVHKDAVEEGRLAHNRKTYTEPKFLD